MGVQRAKPFGKSEEVTTKTKPIPKSSKTKAIPQMRGWQKTENAQKQRIYQTIKPEQPRISNSAVLFMSAQSAKSEAILRRTTIKPNKGASPCRHEQTQRIPYGYPTPDICLNGSGCGNTWIYMYLCNCLLVIHTVMTGLGLLLSSFKGVRP